MDTSSPMERFLASVEKRAFRMAELATGNREDALDLVQDSMYGLVRSYADRPESEWRPLFFRILQNRVRDWSRRKRFRGAFRVFLTKGLKGESDPGHAEPLNNLPDPESVNPAREVQRRDEARNLKKALAGLPQRQQQAFLLRAWERLSIQETARAMKCSEGSVKTHYSRAVQALRRQLDMEQP